MNETDIFKLHDEIVKYYVALLTVRSEADALGRLGVPLPSKSARDKGKAKATEPEVPPVNRLPAELLSEIMVQALPDDQFRDWYKTLLFTRVCSYWRIVAQDTPHLWCSINIAPRPNNLMQLKMRHVNFFMRMWLARSEPYPISVSLSLPSSYLDREFTRERDQSLECIQLLSENLYRCKALRLAAPFQVISMLADAPLEYLADLRLLNDTPRDPMTLSLPSLAAAPALRTVHLAHVSPAFSLDTFDCVRLTELSLETRGPAVLRCMELIVECTNLETLKLHVEKVSKEDFDAWPNAALRRPLFDSLETLQVTARRCAEDFGRILSWLYIPVLRRLRVVGNGVSWARTRHMILRDACQLREVEVHQDDSKFRFFPEESDLLEFLRCVPELRVLKLGGTRSGYKAFTEDIVKAMTYKPEGNLSEYLLPQLEVMDISYITRRCQAHFIEEMLDSRREVPADASGRLSRIKNAVVVQPAPWMPNHQKWRIEEGGEVQYQLRQYSGNMDLNPDFCWSDGYDHV
ncbi:hypothetical protein GLOTRDRAFT_141258 [Gloeophyllum trabeum ATCC 11539]|uniref:Uncharacterized protein n=1 Tax=Gloeophyllum trabeum (strain ATCC 11539 / FP-39264 / Madison 617) TaxID=670483 RepID=S7PUS6_GLOTA|nr:uncharacterized protein GLOTRDRAFT_141258 [Gloeophyllum trabeum ATCC 11539]EPQ51158.1 hypothetical protein GLOTRDRAFT_141258 [Gloeophyllum trabeum ATCC 11539]